MNSDVAEALESLPPFLVDLLNRCPPAGSGFTSGSSSALSICTFTSTKVRLLTCSWKKLEPPGDRPRD
jgi:hypothetical protein